MEILQKSTVGDKRTENCFINNANLPEQPIEAVIIGEGYVKKLSPGLKKLDIDIISLPASKRLESHVANHADMLLLHIRRERAVISRELEGERGRLKKLGLNIAVADNEQQRVYPYDIGLNTLIIGGNAFGKLEYTDPAVLRELIKAHIKTINVNQGYAKCSVCVVDAYSAITADTNMYGVMTSVGINTLLIEPGHITLPGYVYGFIGGACGKISNNKMAFTGKLDKHPDVDRIIRFMGSRGVEPIFLTDEPCFDIGSIIPIQRRG